MASCNFDGGIKFRVQAAAAAHNKCKQKQNYDFIAHKYTADLL
jgi:hypothetical protein